jgi:hypothetical protein
MADLGSHEGTALGRGRLLVEGDDGIKAIICQRTGRVQAVNAAQQVAGADLAVENPLEACIAFAVFQVKFGDTAPAARQLSSQALGGQTSERV